MDYAARLNDLVQSTVVILARSFARSSCVDWILRTKSFDEGNRVMFGIKYLGYIGRTDSTRKSQCTPRPVKLNGPVKSAGATRRPSRQAAASFSVKKRFKIVSHRERDQAAVNVAFASTAKRSIDISAHERRLGY